MFFERQIYPELKRHLKVRQITVITGMRQTGKTTLLKRLLEDIKSENKLYLDLERLDHREIFQEKNYDLVLKALESLGLKLDKKIYLAIDEIQMFSNLPSVMKYLYDHHDIKFIVTGSSSYYLKNLFSESLSGRKRIFELFPLTFGEFLIFKQQLFKSSNFLTAPFLSSEYERLKGYYEEYISFGGFPDVVLAKTKKEKVALANDILSSYFNIDVETLADFHKSAELHNLLKLLAVRAGGKVDYSKLSSMSGLSRITVKNYVEFLEKTYVIHRLPVLAKRPDREIAKAQKIYLCDTGILNILVEASGGVQFENAVFNQLRQSGKLQYYALKTGREIDFILDGAVALECKETPTSQNLRDLENLARIAGIKKIKLIGRHKSPKFDNFLWGGMIK